MTKFQKWQMDLVVAADMAESGLTAEAVVRQFAALDAADLEQVMQREGDQQEKEELSDDQQEEQSRQQNQHPDEKRISNQKEHQKEQQNEQQNDEPYDEHLRRESETWTEENWASMVVAFQLTSFKEKVLTAKFIPDSPLERAYKSFVNSADQLSEEVVGIGPNRKEWDRQLSFVEAIVNSLRNSHDAGHLRESASSFDRSLISVVDVCRTGFENLSAQGTAFSDLLSQTAYTAAALRGELLLAV